MNLERELWEGEHLGIWTLAALRSKLGLPPRARFTPDASIYTRARKGVFFTSSAEPRAVFAAKRGVSISCLPACKIYGLWTRFTAGHHVLVPRHAKVPGSRLEHACRMATPRFAHHLAYLPDALTHVALRHSTEEAFIVIESAINKQKISFGLAQNLLRNAPTRTSRIAHLLDPNSQSGSETRVRLFLQSKRINVKSQVPIPNVGFVDLLVGNSLIIEVDSLAHHTSPKDYEKDRGRDLAAIKSGYFPLRLSYAQVWESWEQTKDDLLRLIRTRRHLRPPRPLGL